MADQILDKIRDAAEGQTDFEGQRLAEYLSTILLSTVGVVSFGAGYLLQDIKLALFIALGGSVLVFLAVVPAWPFFNRHPVRWLAAGGRTTTHNQKTNVDGLLVG